MHDCGHPLVVWTPITRYLSNPGKTDRIPLGNPKESSPSTRPRRSPGKEGGGGPAENKSGPGRRPDLARDPDVPGQVAPGMRIRGVVHVSQGEADDVGAKPFEGAPQGSQRGRR